MLPIIFATFGLQYDSDLNRCFAVSPANPPLRTGKQMENIQTITAHDQTGNLNYQTYDAPRSEDGKRVSESLYWEKYYEHPDFSYEWNRGYLEEKPVSDLMNVKMGQ